MQSPARALGLVLEVVLAQRLVDLLEQRRLLVLGDRRLELYLEHVARSVGVGLGAEVARRVRSSVFAAAAIASITWFSLSFSPVMLVMPRPLRRKAMTGVRL